MPTYDYACDSCKNTAQKVMRMSEIDDAVVMCENCEIPMDRVIVAQTKHVDNTPWRKGHYNSKEDWR